MKIIKKFITLSILLACVLFSKTELNVQASGVGDANTGGGAGGTAHIDGGPAAHRTGWLFYCIDLDNNQVTDTMAVTVNGQILKKDGTPVPASNIKLESRYGVSYSWIQYGGASWGAPFDDSGNSRTEAVNNHFKAIEPNGKSYAYNIIERVFGQDKADQFKNRELYYVLEPFFWHNIHNGGPTGDWFCTTSYWWGYIQTYFGLPTDGDPMINKYTNGNYPNCMKLENKPEVIELGYTPAAEAWSKITNEQMNNKDLGYGIGIFWHGESDEINTYWEPHDSPGPPEPADPPGPKSGIFNIVKSYYTDENNGQRLTFDGNYFELNTTGRINILDEPKEYKLVAWEVTTQLNTDPDVVTGNRLVWNPDGTTLDSGKAPTTVNIKTPAKTVYLLLKRVKTNNEVVASGNYILSESSITRRILLSTPDTAIAGTNIKDAIFKDTIAAHASKCDGHTVSCTASCPQDCTGHSDVFCDLDTWDDDSITRGYKNSWQKSYPKILATSGSLSKQKMITFGKATAWTGTYTRTDASKEWSSTKKGLDWTGVLMRGQDKLTLAKWKNDDISAARLANTYLKQASSWGFNIANSPVGSRKTSDYNDSFSVKFTSTQTGDNAESTTRSGGSEGCEDVQTMDTDTKSVNNIKVGVEVYSGQSSLISDTSVDSGVNNSLRLGGFQYTTGRQVKSGGTISFYPYIRMRYQTISSSLNKWNRAYVLGQYKRSITTNDYAEISWGLDESDGKLTIDSLQWSTHASATDYVKDRFGDEYLGKIKVLPGGATLSLSIKDDDTQKVRLTTWQCVVMGSGLKQVNNTGGSDGGQTPEAAIAAHEAYVESVINDLEKVSVEQWITSSQGDERKTKDVWNCSSSSVVGPEENLWAAKHQDQEGSTETKYYLRPEGTDGVAEASEGDLDVNEVGTTTEYVTIFTDTQGNIRYITGDVNSPGKANVGTEGNGQIANKNDGGLIQNINDRTGIIDKLESALERYGGNETKTDSSVSKSANWYNEAFDGITVMIQKTDLKAGFIKPAIRSTVLDPKLTQTSTGQRDEFNVDKYNMSQFRTKEYSEVYAGESAQDRRNKLGSFKGVEMYTNKLNLYFKSDKFLVPNVTVQDLN